MTKIKLEDTAQGESQMNVTVLNEWVVVAAWAGLSLVGRKLSPGRVEINSQADTHLKREQDRVISHH